MSKKAAPGKTTKKKKKGGMGIVIAGLFGVLILIYLLSFAAMLVLLGMLPSFVALYIDSSPGKQHARIIAACNSAGIIPYISDLVSQGITSSSVHGLMMDPVVWMVLLGSAACGWALVWSFPRMATAVVKFMQDANIGSLEKKQKEIVEEWGPDVASTAQRAMRNAAYTDKRDEEADLPAQKQLPAPKKK